MSAFVFYYEAAQLIKSPTPIPNTCPMSSLLGCCYCTGPRLQTVDDPSGAINTIWGKKWLRILAAFWEFFSFAFMLWR